MDENLPVLLDFSVSEDVIKIRLDNQGLLCFNLAEQEAICELELRNYQRLGEMSEQLQEANGQVFEHSISQEDNKINFEFWSDYGRIESEINCDSITQSFSPYTANDLARKGSLLADYYIGINNSYNANSNAFFALTDKLETEISDETTRFQRKADFYKDKDLGKSEAFGAGVKVLEKFLRIVKPNLNF